MLDSPGGAPGLLINTVGTDRFQSLPWDGQNLLSRLYDGGEGEDVAQFTQTPNLYGKLLSLWDNQGSRFHLFDALGSTIGLTDPSQALIRSYIY